MTILKLRDIDGGPVWLVAEHIVSLRPIEHRRRTGYREHQDVPLTQISMTNGDVHDVVESMDEVAGMLLVTEEDA